MWIGMDGGLIGSVRLVNGLLVVATGLIRALEGPNAEVVVRTSFLTMTELVTEGTLVEAVDGFRQEDGLTTTEFEVQLDLL